MGLVEFHCTSACTINTKQPNYTRVPAIRPLKVECNIRNDLMTHLLTSLPCDTKCQSETIYWWFTDTQRI